MKVEHYQHGECETVDFVEEVLRLLQRNVTAKKCWAIGNALKYACRAGYKGDWREDAKKCADFLNRAMTGEWLSDVYDPEQRV